MSRYLEEYGAGEEQKIKLIRNSIIITAAVLILGGLSFYLFHNYHQIRAAKHFLTLVRSKDYQGAYLAWNCAASNSCKEYTYDKFLEDWGPKSFTSEPILRVTDSESCNQGIIITVNAAVGRTETLWLEKRQEGLSYSPYPVCPGKGAWSIMLHRTVGRLRKIIF